MLTTSSLSNGITVVTRPSFYKAYVTVMKLYNPTEIHDRNEAITVSEMHGPNGRSKRK